MNQYEYFTAQNPALSTITPHQLQAILDSLPDGAGDHLLTEWDEETIHGQLKLVAPSWPPGDDSMPRHWIRDLALRGVANLTPEERYPPSKYLQFTPEHSCWNNPYWVVQRHKQRRQEARTVSCSCHKLNCGCCGPERKDAWEDTLLPQILKSEYTEILEVPATEWRALQMRIWRQEGQYARFIKARPDEEGQLKDVQVTVDVPVDVRSPSLSEDVDVDVNREYREEQTHVYIVITTAKVGGVELSDDVAARKRIVRNCLLFAPFHRGAVSASKGWSPKKSDQGGATPDWEIVPRRNGKPGVGRMGNEKRIREVLERDGVTQIDARDDGNRSEIRFRVPEVMDDFHLSLLVDRLLNCPQGRKKKSPGK